MRCAAAILSLLIAGQSSAQAPVVTPAQSNQPRQPPRRVDQTVADLNPLSTSLRYLSPGLREPGGFRELMEVPGRPDLLMRANGEVYAVFPRSEYSAVQGGIMSTIPANTIFYIGKPPSMETLGRSFPASTNERVTRMNNRAIAARQQGQINSTVENHRIDNQAAAREPDVPPPFVGDPDAPDKRMIYDLGGPVNIITDHSYRLWRLQELLQRAAKAESAKATAVPES